MSKRKTKIKQDPRNARAHSDRNKKAIRDSLEKLGAGRSVVADKDGVLIAGNGVWEQAEALGIPHRIIETDGSELVVIKRTDLDPDDERRVAPAVADNRTTDMSEFDLPSLGELLGELPDDLQDMLGFTPVELRDIFPPEPPTDPGTPDPPAEPRTEEGRMYQLGRHRVACGDSTDGKVVKRLLDGATLDCIVTDPPYSVGVDYGEFQDTKGNVLDAPCAAMTPGVPAMWSYPRPKWVGAWVHPAPSGGCPWGFVGNNPILYYGADPYLKDGKGRRPDSIVMASDREGVDGHPTPKPLKVWSWLVERLTPEKGQLILDPFLGSGTTLIAAEQLDRTCYGIEISPAYCDVVVQRYCNLTDQDADKVFETGVAD